MSPKSNSFDKTLKFFDRIEDAVRYVDLAKYGRMGVKALEEATPKDSGETAKSWYYTIEHDKVNKTYSLNWYNSNVENDWFPVAIMLQYGHATRNGGYVKGMDYINPALRPIFEQLADDAWKEVTNA